MGGGSASLFCEADSYHALGAVSDVFFGATSCPDFGAIHVSCISASFVSYASAISTGR